MFNVINLGLINYLEGTFEENPIIEFLSKKELRNTESYQFLGYFKIIKDGKEQEVLVFKNKNSERDVLLFKKEGGTYREINPSRDDLLAIACEMADFERRTHGLD